MSEDTKEPVDNPEEGEVTDQENGPEPDAEENAGPPEEPDSEPPAPPSREAPPTRSGGRGLAALALLLALGSAGLSGYLYWRSQEAASSEPEVDWQARIESAASNVSDALEPRISAVSSRIERVESSLAGELEAIRSETTQLEGRLDSIAARADAGSTAAQRVEENLRQELRSLTRRLEIAEKSVGQLAGERRDEDDRLLVAEAEFLMRLAATRLSLFEDPDGSITALSLAESNLAAVDDPLYASVRQTLAKEIQRLRDVELPDRTEISGALAAIADSVEQWPLLQQRKPKPGSANVIQPDTEEQGWWAKFRAALAEVAVVHRDQPDATEPLTIEQERLLRENIRLQLRVAQLAAVRGDQGPYRDAIAQVSAWIERYFREDNPAVAAALTRLEALSATAVAPDLPAIGQALRELRSLRASADFAEEAP
ncbi:MAG: uroporphyrinogen-III C-methyltransferase [Xanthomonadales bacterium]|nr:uroporphyrinogen-III C-methyltransferase [Xanthomonadales bacterium]